MKEYGEFYKVKSSVYLVGDISVHARTRTIAAVIYIHFQSCEKVVLEFD